jgi:hypothetical protein
MTAKDKDGVETIIPNPDYAREVLTYMVGLCTSAAV